MRARNPLLPAYAEVFPVKQLGAKDGEEFSRPDIACFCKLVLAPGQVQRLFPVQGQHRRTAVVFIVEVSGSNRKPAGFDKGGYLIQIAG